MHAYDFDSLTEGELRERQSYKWTQYSTSVLPAFVAEMDLPLCIEVQDVLRAAVSRGDLGYVPMQDKTRFSVCVTSWCGRMFDWHPDPAHVFMVSDVVVGMETAVLELTLPGEGVIITPPIYPPFLAFSKAQGRVPVSIGLQRSGGPRERDELGGGREWRLDLEAIDAAFANGTAKVLALCHPHNPTGTIFTVEELDAVIASANRYGCFVVTDEIHAPLVYDGGFVPLGSRPGAANVVVTVTAASKTWNLAGLKCATLIVSGSDLASRLRPAFLSKRFGVGLLGLMATMTALDHGEPWRLGALAHLRNRRDQLTARLVREAPFLKMTAPHATYLGWVDATALCVGGAQTDDPSAYFLTESNVAFSIGATFGDDWNHWFRWNFATTSALLDETIDRVVASLPTSRPI
jgi:cysteine-S-conjugate beta-lyase